MLCSSIARETRSIRCSTNAEDHNSSSAIVVVYLSILKGNEKTSCHAGFTASTASPCCAEIVRNGIVKDASIVSTERQEQSQWIDTLCFGRTTSKS
jgi:hypothetical protein